MGNVREVRKKGGDKIHPILEKSLGESRKFPDSLIEEADYTVLVAQYGSDGDE